ncbi:MARVEL domain-containing protein 2-like isoform X1 [Arapaima gigas]
MSTGGDPFARFNRAQDAPYYDQVPLGSLRRDDDPNLLQQQSELALSSDPLPPPPLPDQPPVGPDFDPSSSEDNMDTIDIKPVHKFIPDSWKNFFRTSNRSSKPRSMGSEDKGGNTSSRGVRCSPPHSPCVPGSYRDPYGGSGGSYHSQKEHSLLLHDPLESIDGRTVQTALTYSERVEEYNMRYAYMKSWAGLLRILGCVELLLGAAVFACVCAYVHKDNEWFNRFGYSQPQMFNMYGGSGGSYYAGPQTPFVLVVVGLAWVVTVILLVLGMTMYYRTILLDSNWWPLTEFVINLVLAVLYMAGGIVYVRDTIRGGLCYYPFFNNGINGPFCRTEAGQTAAIIFLFVNMLVYLIGAIVCLKLWRHEVARRFRESLGLEVRQSCSSLTPTSQDDAGYRSHEPKQIQPVAVEMDSAVKEMQPEILRGHIPSGHIPKPVIMPDYVQKYPTIQSDEERDQYKAVFNDQYAEYKELHAEVQAVLRKFDEMDGLMRSLPQHPSSQMEHDRINRILQEYERKKNDPTFLEKKERCDYLKNKLSHIKQKIQEYNKVMEWNDGYS